MKAEDVSDDWVDVALDAHFGDGYPGRAAWKRAIAAVASLIARAERERCAREIDCGCPGRETVLNVTNNGRGNTNGAVRWTSCGRDLCSALEAAAIRALPDA